MGNEIERKYKNNYIIRIRVRGLNKYKNINEEERRKSTNKRENERIKARFAFIVLWLRNSSLSGV